MASTSSVPDPLTFKTSQTVPVQPSNLASPVDGAKWDVFLSFRGPDTRVQFTNYLYHTLEMYGLDTIFKDEPELQIGEVISQKLKEAIDDSKTYVVVFSKDYATSPWCLDELAQIYKCYEQKKRLVIGVYYGIDPSVVRHQLGSFEDSFKKHETGRFHYKKDRVKEWRRALTGVASFSGLTISEKKGVEVDNVEIIKQIAEVIWEHVKPKILPLADHFVARKILEDIKNTIRASLGSETVKDVIKIGLHGFGGVGKTTLAKALYNNLLEIIDFRASCCFLANMREVCGRPNGLVSLQNQLISALFKSKTINKEVYNEDQGTQFIKDRLGKTKVLLLLDDVDNFEQCKSFMGPFAPGSVVIITTRNMTTLDNIVVERTHRFEIEVMKHAESLALFTAHAFPNAEPDKDLMNMFGNDILSLAGNLPLALRVFGSNLSIESKEGWEDYIKKLKLNPNSTIMDRLMISLDAMKDLVLKNIFIDIACFFNGRNINEAVKIMETCYPVNVDHNIRTLKKRSLLTINLQGELRMHDLLRDMGWEVARNKCPGEPRKYSRLWIPSEIYDLLAEGKGKEAIEGIIPSNFNYENALKGVKFSTKTFKKMSKLRLLYLKDVNLTGSFEQRFGSLTWFCWDCYPLMELGSDFWPKKLVILELRNSNIKKWELTKVFDKLKSLDMSDSLNITTLPDFRNLPILEILNLEGCTSLEKFDILYGCLTKLVSLNLGGCVNLGSICDSHCSLKALEVLVVTNCQKLKSLPDNLWDIASFQKLSIGVNGDSNSTTEFESSFKRLSMIGSSLTTLPSSLRQLLNLVDISITSPNLVFIEQLPPNLEKLYLSCTGLKRLPNLSKFKRLEELNTMHCSGLKEIIGLEEIITSLQLLCCNSSHVAYSSLRRIVQNHLEKEIAIYVDKLPDWMHSSDGDIYAREAAIFAPNVPHNFLGLILGLSVQDFGYVRSLLNWDPCQTVNNVTTGDTYELSNIDDYEDLVMILIPRSIIPVSGGDKIVTSGEAYLRGFGLLYDD